MNIAIMITVVLLPIFGGILIPILPMKNRKTMMCYIEALVLINSALVIAMLINKPQEAFVLFRFTGNLSVSFHLDGLGTLFAGLVALLWPFSILYSFEYMEKEEREKTFFMFYVITYGVTLGVAMADNILTLYFFFEMLSLITLPLIMHTQTREAILASRTYLYFMIGGAAFAFIGMIFILSYGSTSMFVAGGVIDFAKLGNYENLALIMYVMAFFGFGMKTAVFPFSTWLPKAGVAPTPVTALLHAVAVVNTGAFAVMRVTYYSFGADFIKGTWAQNLVMAVVIFTIIYGSARALKETHIKRRLAWSTVSNLSYILFGVTLMSAAGFTGAMLHMLFHSFMKITSFFCAGAVMHQSGKSYIYELNGMGKKMPKTFVIFTIAGLALMGVPGMAGFISKWHLMTAAVENENPIAVIGVTALLISALLTAMYMLTISVRAFFPGKDFDDGQIKSLKDPGWMMMIPLIFFVAVVILFGVYSHPFVEAIQNVASVM